MKSSPEGAEANVRPSNAQAPVELAHGEHGGEAGSGAELAVHLDCQRTCHAHVVDGLPVRLPALVLDDHHADAADGVRLVEGEPQWHLASL